MKAFVSLCLLLFAGISLAQDVSGNRSATPWKGDQTCRGIGGLPRWGVKLIANKQIRFTFDATDVDTCTIYYDLEFVAKLLDSHGSLIATRRFAVPKANISGPSINSFDFDSPAAGIASVKGIALYCKKRKLGGLPNPGDQTESTDPVIYQARLLFESFKSEKRTYDEWSTETAPDNDALMLERQKQFGDPVLK